MLLVALMFFLGIIGYVFSTILKFKEHIKGVFYVLIPLVFLLLLYNISDNRINKLLNKNATRVTKAIIYDTRNTKTTFGIRVKLIVNFRTMKGYYRIKRRHRNCKKHIIIGDTVLIMYSEKCVYITDIYKLCPTKSELEKCKNDCYLIHGKLIPIDEYNKSKTKYLY
jgi:hypothetical protein